MNEMSSSTSAARPSGVDPNLNSNKLQEREALRSAFVWLALFVLLINGSWAVYRFQYESLPPPLDAKQAGKRGFSEVSAMEHVKYLTSLGPHPVGSDALDAGIQYVLAESNKIKQTAHWEVDVQVNLFHAKIGANRLSGGLFKGKTLIYSDLKHVLLRILPKYLPEAEDNAILISSHIDTVFSAEGAGDCTSCVSVMLELARATAQWAHGFKNAVIFLFNTGEEEGLNGAHSFISQHPWSRTIRFMVDLEAMGIGGKSSIFQSGPSPWAMETFAKVAKYPSGQVVAEDLFHSGAIKSATDFQVYQEVAGLSGLDFAYTDSTAVYHTKNDKLKLLKPGSLQHLGENMLAFLLQSAMSPNLAKEVAHEPGATSEDRTIYFDVLGVYMVVYRQRLATMLHNSVILQALLIWITSLLMGGSSGAISLGLACLSVALMWIFSLSLSALVAFILPHISSSPMPYISNPWLIVGLFGAPALFGAFSGQRVGFYFLQKYLKISFSNRVPKLPSRTEDNLIKWEAERWLFKSGFVQWLIILVLGHLYKARSTYLALIWLVSPAFAYGLMEATLTPSRSPKQLKVTTLVLGLTLPVVVSSANTIRLIGTIIGNMVRLDRDPGSTPEWLGNLIVAIFVAVVVCLFLVYLLSYIHNSGAKRPFIFFSCALFGLSLVAVSTGVFPVYTEDISRAVNVVHVVETMGTSENHNISSYISLFSPTPGKLNEVVKNFNDEEFSCGRNKTLDLVTSTVRYGCWSSRDTEEGWSKSEIPILNVESDYEAGIRKTQIFIDTKISRRWALAINTKHISDFSFEVNSQELIPEDSKSSVNGWHIIQFSGGKDSPTKFHLNLVWLNNSKIIHKQDEDSVPLLKLRTDVNRITPKAAGVLEKLPAWCSLFGKSTGPYTLAFLSSLPIDF